MGAPERSGWPAVFACFCLAIFAWSFGFYGQAVFLAGLQRANGWPASLISAATTTYYLVGALFLAFVPEIVERFGRRPAILAGMAVMAATAFALPAAHDAPTLFGLNVAMAAGWALTSGTAITAALGPWFGRRRGLAISLALNGASAAGFTAVPLMIRAVEYHGFAEGVRWTVAILAFAVAPIVLTLLRAPSPAWIAAERGELPGAGGTATTGSRPAPETRRAALALPRFWLAALPFGLGLMAQIGFIVHQVAFLLPRLGPGGTGLAVALTTVAALVGRVVVAIFIDRLDRRNVTAASFLSQALALTAMLTVPGEEVLYAGSFVFGLSVGNAITLPALVILDEFAPAAFGMVIGLTTASNQFLYAFGPLLVGALHDLSGGYAMAFVACMALEIAAASLAIAGRPTAASAPDDARRAAP